MIKNNYIFEILFCLISFNFSNSQDTIDSLKTQQVIVVKSYSPSLSDVFLISSTPKIPDTLIQKKYVTKYNLLSIPVLSTFKPNKASPLNLIKQEYQSLYNTIFLSGLGNQGQIYFNATSLLAIDRNQSIGFIIDRYGYSNNVPGTKVKSNENNTLIGVNHVFKTNELRVDSKFLFESGKNNFYGLNDENLDPLWIKNTNPLISVNHFNIENSLNVFDGFLKSTEFQVNLTTDNFQTSEQQLFFKINLKAPLLNSYFIAQAKVNVLISKFEEDFFSKKAIESKYFNPGFKLEWINLNNNIKINLGVHIDYMDMEQVLNNKINYYPKIYLSYIKNKKVAPYFSSEGGLRINTYFSSTRLNPFLSPSFQLKPTSSKYDFKLGVKSKINSFFEFDFSVRYDEVENFNLFKRLPYDYSREKFSYALSNSYMVDYRDLNMVDIQARFKLIFKNSSKIIFTANFTNYDSSTNEPLWNLPSMKMNLEGLINISKNLSGNFNSYIIGDRQTALWPIFLNQDPIDANFIVENIPFFLFGEITLNYKLIDQFDLFIKGAFSSNHKYGKWAYFNRHQNMFLFGIRYKLDL